MGCNDEFTNFGAEHFDEEKQKWFATWGDLSWTGPIKELTNRFPDFAEPTFDTKYGWRYSVEHLDENKAIIKPIGQIALL